MYSGTEETILLAKEDADIPEIRPLEAEPAISGPPDGGAVPKMVLGALLTKEEVNAVMIPADQDIRMADVEPGNPIEL